MSNYILACNSTVDLPAEHLEKRSIPYVCMHFTISGKEYEDDLGRTIPYDEFYRLIDAGAMPTTSQVNVEEHLAFFEKYLIEGRDIIYLSLSSALSGTYGTACIAADELREKYRDRTIKIVDTLGASSGYGLLVDTLADMRDAGATLDEVYLWAQTHKLNLHHWFFSTDLTHYKRGGRISPAAAAFGSILNICPLLNMSWEGKLIPRKKIRGKKRTIAAIVEQMEAYAEGGTSYSGKCFISQSACIDDAERVAKLIEERFLNLRGKVRIFNVGAVIGAHTGPGTVALFFFGSKRVD